MTTPDLNGHHRKTLTAIFSHPAPHTIEWHDVLSLLNHLGTATPRHVGDGSRCRVDHKQGDDDHDGGRASEDDGWYHRIADELGAAERVVVLSDGKGRSSAGEYLVEYVKRHDPTLAARIIASEKIDISQTSDKKAVAAGLALIG